jgi:hypothetical protein
MLRAIVGKHDGINNLYQTLSSIRVENAIAFVEEDRTKILDIVNSTAGFDQVNNGVAERFAFGLTVLLKMLYWGINPRVRLGQLRKTIIFYSVLRPYYQQTVLQARQLRYSKKL